MSKIVSTLGHHQKKYTTSENDVLSNLCKTFDQSPLSLVQRLQTFPRHTRRQDIARFLAKYEIFKLSLQANGSIVECGVFGGGGLFSWMHFSAIFEPYNHTRRIIGFDTFEGFPHVHEKDVTHGTSEHLQKGAFTTTDSILTELQEFANLHDLNRPIGHIPKIELVPGDACKTIPQYVETHPHLLISLIYLDFDTYEPTKIALEQFYPRIVKGGVVAFDELNCPEFPGETIALLETLDMKQIELRRCAFDPYISYFIKS